MVNMSSPHILVVDDDELVSAYIGALLESEDYRVTIVNESRLALDSFLSNPADFDLVVTDQMMPGLTGVQITREMKKASPNKPIIMVSGFTNEVNENNATELGLSGFFSKPIDEASLLERIDLLTHTANVA